MDEEINKNVLKSGTTILGIVCKDGIVMAADRQASAGNLVMQKNAEKAVQINDYLVVSGTGVSSDIQMLKKVIAAELKLKELRTKQRPTVKESANLTGMITYRNIRNPSMIHSIVGTLVAGFDEDGSCELYSVEPAGGIDKIVDYDANFSSGMPFVLGFLERHWKAGLTVKEGVDLAVEAVKSSTQRDMGSGFGIDVFTITKDGIKQVVKQKINPSFVND
ncbi:proteasome subunit beta [Candidatus Pacearchaeota archaeon CG10_big_fil_rev_8_21_14_0_10_35_13]|nr:MAG: proteasome subunit beta [Candidatus Pacearchaeota archaeon CG10_big_fil_rev_8_21_14_0_10_35_13]